jgi:hypothetical protein
MANDYIYNTPYTRNAGLMTALTQSRAEGAVPSARIIRQLIDAELDAASNNMYRNKALQLQKEAQAEQVRQFGVSQQNAVETASANRTAGLVGTGMNVLGTYGLYRALRPAQTSTPTGTGGGTYTVGDWQNSPSNPNSPATQGYDAWNNYIQNEAPYSETAVPTQNVGPVTNQIYQTDGVPELNQYQYQGTPGEYYGSATEASYPLNVAGDTTFVEGAAPGVNVAGTTGVTESAIPATSTELAGAGAGETAAYELGGSGASGAGAAGAETAGVATIGSYLTPVGYVAAALGAKKQWGGQGIPWEEKTTFQKATTAPGTSGALLPLTIGSKVFGEESVFGKAYKEMARIEEKVMEPIQQVFDWFGGLF